MKSEYKTDTLHFSTEQAISNLLKLKGTTGPDRPFCEPYTYGDIHAMAHAILRQCPVTEHRLANLVIFTTNRAVIAAAVIAALAGGPILILPHNISDQDLMDQDLMDQNLMDLALMDPEHTRVVTDPGRTLSCQFKQILITPDDQSRDFIPLNPAIDPDAPLLKIHTGGSTGKPAIWTKTVENIIGEALFHVRTHDITCDDMVISTVPPYHIYGLLFSVAAPLLAGARVADQTGVFPHEIINTVVDKAATILVSVPAHFRALKGHDFLDHNLRLAFSSAGVLDEAYEVDFRKRNKVFVVEVYGSTETGGIAFRCRGRGETFFSPFTIIETSITNQTLKIRSPFVSPEIVLDDSGFDLVPDRVKQCSDNSFAILGRSDTIVKIAGVRVDLDQVGSVLKTMDGVRDAQVLVKAVPRGRAFDICALVQGNCTRTDIRQFLADRLGTAAQPRWIKVVDKMPVTCSGKYDRAAIAAFFELNKDNDEDEGQQI